MTEYFKWKTDSALPGDPNLVVLEPFHVISKKTDDMEDTKIFRELDSLFNGKASLSPEKPASRVSIATFPEQPSIDAVLENFLPPDVWVKLHGGIKIGDTTAYIHSGLSWRIDKRTEFICPLFERGIHGAGFGIKHRF